MRIALFCHSIRSDWNHGNAHFLRGVVSELQARGHEVVVHEPEDSWSAVNLVADAGSAALEEFRRAYPSIQVRCYRKAAFDVEDAIDRTDLVLVHEWTPAAIVAALGARRRRGSRFVLLFHDTHHRSVSKPGELADLDLSGYDGVLAFGEAVREQYVRRGWAARAWTWHEAADTRVFRPLGETRTNDLVWIGNWGDDERTEELDEFLFRPARALGVSGHVYGVRYPDAARDAVKAAGLTFAGRLPNAEVPAVFARHRVTVHVPRRPYATQLPGVPTIRMFEALACGIPLVSAPWDDVEGLFIEGRDFLMARNTDEMTMHLRTVLRDPATASALAANGPRTIAARHTCAHRVDELFSIVSTLAPAARGRAS